MAEAAVAPPSFWLAEAGEPLVPRPVLSGEAEVDVAIVGGGYTGLWTAYYLGERDPSLRIAIVEAQVAGFGASGRNGGWCTPHHAGAEGWMSGPRRAGAIALQQAMTDTVDEVGRVAEAEGIVCDWAKGGFLTVAASPVESRRAQRLLAELHRRGFSEDDYRWVDAGACAERVRIAGACGGVYSPHGAALQPAKLARGLARVVEARGVSIYERSPAHTVTPGKLVTERGFLRARTVLVCTEGYTRHLRDARRCLLPLHSLMLVTEPLSEALLEEVGARDRVVFGDVRRVITYAQRTVDGRIALGAGGRYFYGSGVRDYLPPAGPLYREAEEALHRFFPCLQGVAVTHRWGGALGVPRDTRPFVRYDPRSGIGGAGGYVGNGVATSNLAGRTLADLVSGQDSERTRHPWVQHRSPRWEPEPLRWLGVNAVLRMSAAADRAEHAGRPAGLRALFDAAVGH